MTEISQKKRLMIEYLLECQFGRYFEELKGTQTIGPVIAKKIETWENCDEDALALLCDAESGRFQIPPDIGDLYVSLVVDSLYNAEKFPDFEHWLKFERWTEKQLAALSLGLNPNHMEVAETHLLSTVRIHGNQGLISSLYENLPPNWDSIRALYMEQREVIQSAQGLLDKDGKVEVKKGLEWLMSRNMPVHEEMQRLVADDASSRKPSVNTENAKTRNNLTAIIASLAIKHYGYQPHKEQQGFGIMKKLLGDLEQFGLRPKNEIVKRYIEDGIEQIDTSLLDS